MKALLLANLREDGIDLLLELGLKVVLQILHFLLRVLREALNVYLDLLGLLLEVALDIRAMTVPSFSSFC